MLLPGGIVLSTALGRAGSTFCAVLDTSTQNRRAYVERDTEHGLGCAPHCAPKAFTGLVRGQELPSPTKADFIVGSHGQLFFVVATGHSGHWSSAWLACRKERGAQGRIQPPFFFCLPLELVGPKSDEARLSVANPMVLLIGQERVFLRSRADLLPCHA